jgi:hypothetical protein
MCNLLQMLFPSVLNKAGLVLVAFLWLLVFVSGRGGQETAGTSVLGREDAGEGEGGTIVGPTQQRQ